MNEWDHLPNAKFIDQVLAALKKNRKQWNAYMAPASADMIEAWDAARNAATSADRKKVWAAARNEVQLVAGNAIMIEPRVAATNAVSAFVAYDDSSKYLDMTASELEVWAKLSQDPAAVLLFPIVQILEPINKVTI